MSKVLLVEDDPAELRLYRNVLITEGYEVVALENGQDCRQKAIDEKPDIILLDVMMPKMNGFETLDVLQFDSITQKIPVIILTNLADPHYEEESLHHGAVKFLVKSQTENKQLLTVIKDILTAFASKTSTN